MSVTQTKENSKQNLSIQWLTLLATFFWGGLFAMLALKGLHWGLPAIPALGYLTCVSGVVGLRVIGAMLLGTKLHP